MTWLYHTLPDCTRVWRWLPESYRRSRGVADAGCVKQAGTLPAFPAERPLSPRYSRAGRGAAAAGGIPLPMIPLAAGGLMGGGFVTGYYGPGLVADALAPGVSPAILIGDHHGISGVVGQPIPVGGGAPGATTIPVHDFVPSGPAVAVAEPGTLAILGIAFVAILLIRLRA